MSIPKDESNGLPSVAVLTAIEDEQRTRRAVVDGTWRISSAIVIGSVIGTASLQWVSAIALIALVVVGTRLVEIETRTCSTRIAAVRRAMMMHQPGDPSRNVQQLVEFVNAPGMVPAVSRYEDWGYWVWALLTIVVVAAKASW